MFYITLFATFQSRFGFIGQSAIETCKQNFVKFYIQSIVNWNSDRTLKQILILFDILPAVKQVRYLFWFLVPVWEDWRMSWQDWAMCVRETNSACLCFWDQTLFSTSEQNELYMTQYYILVVVVHILTIEFNLVLYLLLWSFSHSSLRIDGAYMHTICPWAHQFSNNLSYDHQVL